MQRRDERQKKLTDRTLDWAAAKWRVLNIRYTLVVTHDFMLPAPLRNTSI